MECTQKLECTQDLYRTQREHIQPEQVGFLGINSMKYPVLKGPNKIGRDPSCSIVINQNCISRHHAVINVLNQNSFMIMDLDSTSRTKVYGKTLQPYIPQPLQNGDILQFGNVIGIFRLLEEEDDLPMTQAVDVPDTPIQPKFISKTNSGHTIIPESPDVSDKEDSFIKASQPRHKQFKNDNVHFVKSSKNTIAIQPIGSNKIDNVYWNSSRKSESLHLSMNDSTTGQPSTTNSSKNDTHITDIHEMDTQPALPNSNKSIDSIHPAETQQINKENHDPDSIFSMNTQLPINAERLPVSTQVGKSLNQGDVQLNLYASHNENDDSIFEAATQFIANENPQPTDKTKETNNNKAKDDLNRSNIELEFEDIDNELLDECFESQSLIPTEDIQVISKSVPKVSSNVSNMSKSVNSSHTDKPQSKSSLAENNDDSTDCEDDDDIIRPNRSKSPIINSPTIEKKSKPTNNSLNKSSKNNDICFEEMLTQVIGEEDEILTQVIEINEEVPKIEVTNNDDIEDLPTQVIIEIDENKDTRKSTIEQYSEEVVSPFKMPLRFKKKPQLASPKPTVEKKEVINENNDKYYQSTQEVINDLCSQNKDTSPVHKSKKDISKNKGLLAESPGSSESEEKVNQFVTSLSKSQINNMIGVDSADILNKSTDSSDFDCTPKKVKPLDIMDVELPNTQEIKESLSKYPNQNTDDLSTDSEVENVVEELCDPFLLKKKKQKVENTRKNLNEKFEELSTKSKRTRKPAAKLQDCCENHESNQIKIDKQSPETKNNRDKKSKSDSSKNSKQDKTKISKNEKKDRKDTSNTKLNLSEQSRSKEKSTDKSNKSPTKSTNTSRDTKRSKVIELEIEDNSRTTRNSRSKTKATKSEKTTEKDETVRKSKRNDIKNEKRDVSNSSTERSKHSDISKERNSFKIPIAPEESRSTRSRKKEKEKPDNIIDITNDTHDESDVKVRRSKRQTNKTNESTQLKSILKKSNDQSIVYNESISSNEEVRVSKRPAITYSNGPSSKRSKVDVNSSVNLRPTPSRNVKTQYVLFTAFANDEVKAKLENLGAVIVTDIYKCTVVLTHQIKRTFKLLCVVGLGRPIVGPNWVQACADNNTIVDPWLYLLKDETAEKRFSFSLHRTLTGRRNFLKGYNVFSTPSVMPSASEMKMIVECSGGTWKEGGRNWICVSSMADKHLWSSIKKRGAILVSTEFILQGVLQQKVNIEGTALPVD